MRFDLSTNLEFYAELYLYLHAIDLMLDGVDAMWLDCMYVVIIVLFLPVAYSRTKNPVFFTFMTLYTV